MQKLVDVAESYPQAAYIGFRRGFLSKMTYFFRTIPDFQNYLSILQTKIRNDFVCNLFGSTSSFDDDFIELLSLPTSKGGLDIPDLKSNAQFQYVSPRKITSIHVESLTDQDCILKDKNSSDNTLEELFSAVRKDKQETVNIKNNRVISKLNPDFHALHNQNTDKGASHWLNAIPLKEHLNSGMR